MSRKKFIEAWTKTGAILEQLAAGESNTGYEAAFEMLVRQTGSANPWFTPSQVRTAFRGLAVMLRPEKMEPWLSRYPELQTDPLRVGIVMAGNIPMAGFHDLLCVLASGHSALVKMSASDNALIPWILSVYNEQGGASEGRILVTERLNDAGAIIATGSNNTHRYFEHYFGNRPHLFRKNRNSVAVLNGRETEAELRRLGADIFTYFGLGCRNVSKIFVPEGFVFDRLFEALFEASWVMDHNKYMNNFDYYRALYLMNQTPFLTNNFLLVAESDQLASPVSVLNYEYFNSGTSLAAKLDAVKDMLQCVAGNDQKIPLGNTQFPEIDDYADGVDTMQFLANLRPH